MNFQGYRRPDGKAGTRNYVLVIPSVGCSQGAAQAIARGLKNVVFLPNIAGCGQVGEDTILVKKTLVSSSWGTDVSTSLPRTSRKRSCLPASGWKRS
jgi:altronate dehydratase large subunit